MKIGINSDLNIPVRRSTQKHNFGRGAVKLPHSGVERKHIEVGTSENKATENPATAELEAKPEQSSEKAKQQAETKETQVVKSEKSETSETKTVSTSHENNLNVLIIIAGGLAWFLFR